MIHASGPRINLRYKYWPSTSHFIFEAIQLTRFGDHDILSHTDLLKSTLDSTTMPASYRTYECYFGKPATTDGHASAGVGLCGVDFAAVFCAFEQACLFYSLVSVLVSTRTRAHKYICSFSRTFGVALNKFYQLIDLPQFIARRLYTASTCIRVHLSRCLTWTKSRSLQLGFLFLYTPKMTLPSPRAQSLNPSNPYS